MALPLEGRTAAITGASSGIGEATARALAASGVAVALCARRSERLGEIAAEIEAGGGRAIATPADVAREDEAAHFVTRTAAELGGLDVLVNCAGHLRAGSVLDGAPADWRRMLEVNVLGPLHCIRAALPWLRAGGHGHIVNISSVIARLPLPDWAVYSATKSALSTLSTALRAELLPLDVRVTVMEPGFTDTEMVRDAGVRPVVERLSKQRGTGLMRPEDVAAMIVHVLAQPEGLTVEDVSMKPFR